MKLNAAWKKGSLLRGIGRVVLGFLTDEHPKAGPGRAVLVDAQNKYVSPEELPNEVDVDVYLENGLTEPIRNVLMAAVDVGYPIVARDARAWPAPRMNIYMRIAPGTER